MTAVRATPKTTGLSTPGHCPEPIRDVSFKMVQPGEFAIAEHPDQVLGTLLGSCVAACICDPATGVGGLNHFLLPDGGLADKQSDANAARYGVHAMELLINGILKRGGRKSRMQAKLFGGANMSAFTSSRAVGKSNQEFSLDFLRREGIEVTACDLGGAVARRIYFKPSTNKVRVQTTGLGNTCGIRDAEDQLRRRALTTAMAGEVDLF